MNKQTCSNCQHYHEHNPHENWGKCNQLRVTAETTILAKSQPRAYTHPAFVFSSFGCNEWQSKECNHELTIQSKYFDCIFSVSEKYKTIGFLDGEIQYRDDGTSIDNLDITIDGKSIINICFLSKVPYVSFRVILCFGLSQKENTAIDYLSDLLQKLQEIHK